MSPALFVIYLIVATVAATPIYECGVLDQPFATYTLANDIAVSNLSYGSACFDIKGNGITLDGNGFEVYATSSEVLPATGVQYSGTGATVSNLRVSNFRTGILANGKFGKVHHNTITRAVNGIDVTASNNDVSNNIIRDFNAKSESTSGIYVYFPAIIPVESGITITNNVISNIQGDNFVLGISVYYATSVYIAHNQIFDLRGEVSAEEISVISGKAELVDNIFSSNGYIPTAATLLVSALALIASLAYFRSSSSSPVDISPAPVQDMTNEKDEETRKKEKEQDFLAQDGADQLKLRKNTLSFSLKSSPGMR